jgi:hypothetical protein
VQHGVDIFDLMLQDAVGWGAVFLGSSIRLEWLSIRWIWGYAGGCFQVLI